MPVTTVVRVRATKVERRSKGVKRRTWLPWLLGLILIIKKKFSCFTPPSKGLCKVYKILKNEITMEVGGGGSWSHSKIKKLENRPNNHIYH